MQDVPAVCSADHLQLLQQEQLGTLQLFCNCPHLRMFCAMDNQTTIKSMGNVFKENIGDIFTNNLHLMNIIRNIEAPTYESEECTACYNKYFCCYCIIRSLIAAKEKGFENCAWYSKHVPDEFRRMLL